MVTAAVLLSQIAFRLMVKVETMEGGGVVVVDGRGRRCVQVEGDDEDNGQWKAAGLLSLMVVIAFRLKETIKDNGRRGGRRLLKSRSERRKRRRRFRLPRT
ncbi:MAG: hypothetical protein MPJ53_01595 [Alphaproteobacteria bacterium]|nr:hypothetical protein [Alphaproteobacteria bacterium]